MSAARVPDAPPTDDAAIHMAPVAVVRAARWPVSSLESLAQVRADSHADGLQAELRTLWQRTLGDERFRKALAVSHPDLYARLRRMSCPTRWNKPARQLVATLYRHWARACWRTEPNGLWAGMGLAALQADTEVARVDTVGRVAVAPNLQPFSDLLRMLSRTPAYRCRGRFKVHVSACREADGVWVVRARDGAGIERMQRLRLRHIDSRVADRCIASLVRQGAQPYETLLQSTTELLGCTVTAQALLDQLVAAQLLNGGLALTQSFETVWDALAQAADELQAPHRGAWQAAVSDLKALCLRLEAGHASLGADAIHAAGEEAGRRIVELGVEMGLPAVGLPRACLHWDAGLPARPLLSAERAARLQAALQAHEQHYRLRDPMVSLNEAYARAHDQGEGAAMSRLLASQGDWQSLARALHLQGDDAGLRRRLAGTLEGDDAAVQAALPPFGGLSLRVGRDALLVNGLTHEPWLGYARFGALLGGLKAPHAHALHDWCDRALSRFAQTANVRLTQLRVAYPPLANLLAQPRFSASRPLDIYGTTPGALHDAGVALCHDGQRRWLQCPGELRPVLVLGATTLDVGARDRLIERLLLTGWRYRTPVSPQTLSSVAPPVEAVDSLPADGLRTGLPLQRPRWRLQGDAAREIAHAEPAQRWALWQRWAARMNLPGWLTVSRDGETPLPMPRDSRLAVEVMLRAIGADSVAFDIEAPDDECLITDLEGNRHATEIILVFARRQHAWNLRGDPLAATAAEPGGAEARVREPQAA